MTAITQFLSQIKEGDLHAAKQLLPLVYDELRKLAAGRLALEQPGQTLQATALVHEAYLRLVDVEPAPDWNSRGHFFAAAAEAMRRIRSASKRAMTCEESIPGLMIFRATIRRTGSLCSAIQTVPLVQVVRVDVNEFHFHDGISRVTHWRSAFMKEMEMDCVAGVEFSRKSCGARLLAAEDQCPVLGYCRTIDLPTLGRFSVEKQFPLA